MTAEERSATLESIRQLHEGSFTDHVGLQYELSEDGELVYILDVQPCHLNPNGTVHGGMLFTMMDTAAGFNSRIRHQFKGRVVTQTSTIHYLRPALTGRLRSRVTPVHEGRRTGLYHVEILNEQGQVLCCSDMTMFFLTEE